MLSTKASITLGYRFCFFCLRFLPMAQPAAQKPAGTAAGKIHHCLQLCFANMAPLWITQERGFFRKYGLDVQLVFIESGSTAVQSLISKDVAFAQMAERA